jgi:hypothetical protein
MHSRSMSVCNRQKVLSVEWKIGAGVRCPAAPQGPSFLSSERLCGTAWRCGKYRDGLTQEFGVEVIDKNLLYTCFGETVLAIHGDELTAYALQLWESHGCSGEFDGLLDV